MKQTQHDVPAPQQDCHSQSEHSQSEHSQPKHSQPKHSQPEHSQPEHSQPEHSQPLAEAGRRRGGRAGSRLMFAAVCLAVLAGCGERQVRVGSKSFTEGIILGELATYTLSVAGVPATHERALGDAAAFQALTRGQIDVYADYTGTIRDSVLSGRNLTSNDQLAAELNKLGLGLTRSLGFENTFALGTTRETAERLKLTRISDLRNHPDLRMAFTETFLVRDDCWPKVKSTYQLPHDDLRGMDHDLAYVALQSGELDLIDFYTTDAKIKELDLVILEDDLACFPDYQAVFLYRLDLLTRFPKLALKEKFEQLEDSISRDEMMQMNAAVQLDGQTEQRAAADFLNKKYGYQLEAVEETLWQRLLARTREHLFMVVVAMGLGILVAVPLGIVAQKLPGIGRAILAVVSVLQTIPALALLGLMVPLLGIKSPPAIAALFCYSMLPIVRNTHAGLQGISRNVRESAEVLGLRFWERLWLVELPLASPMVLAGIKTSTVLCIGFAALGAFVSAGGYGEPIMTGIRLQDTSQILQGAIPAAVMAIGSEVLFGWAERLFVPAGLLIKPKE